MLLRDSIYYSIRRAILTCEFQPGQELREQELAARYRVSRSPIRDSLLRLEQEHLVTVLPRQGYSVNPISVSDIKEIFLLRRLIEPACAAAATKADDAALQALDRFRRVADEDFDESLFVTDDQSFHHTVAQLSGNKRLAAIASSVVEQCERLARVGQRAADPEPTLQGCAEHNAIIDALQTRDADLASRLSYEHVERTQEHIATTLGLFGQVEGLPAEPQPNGWCSR